jgi:hypothetical protein
VRPSPPQPARRRAARSTGTEPFADGVGAPFPTSILRTRCGRIHRVQDGIRVATYHRYPRRGLAGTAKLALAPGCDGVVGTVAQTPVTARHHHRRHRPLDVAAEPCAARPGRWFCSFHLRSVERRPARDMTGRGGRGEPGHHPLAVPSSAIPGGVRLVAVAVSVVIGLPVIPAGSLNGPDERGAGRAGRLARARGNGGWAAGELVQAITVESDDSVVDGACAAGSCSRCFDGRCPVRRSGPARRQIRRDACRRSRCARPRCLVDTNLSLTSRPLFQRVL